MSITVFIADDQAMVRQGFGALLGAQPDISVIGDAPDGKAAVAEVARLQPDVVLMDVSMPDVDGVEATRRIHEQYPDVAVVMLTMHADESVIADAIRAGAVGYLVKDCSIDEIAAAIRLAANEDADLSPALAGAMLDEVRKLEPVPAANEADRVITSREVDVLQLIADGCSTPEVAAQLYISQKTVKNHLASIYHKLDARDRTQAVLQAVRMGIVRIR